MPADQDVVHSLISFSVHLSWDPADPDVQPVHQSTNPLMQCVEAGQYQALLDRFSTLQPVSGSVQVMYLTPAPTSAKMLLPPDTEDADVSAFERNLTCMTFADLRALELTRFSEAWTLFKSKVIPEVTAGGPGRAGS